MGPHQEFIKASVPMDSVWEAECYISMCYANHDINNLTSILISPLSGNGVAKSCILWETVTQLNREGRGCGKMDRLIAIK